MNVSRALQFGVMMAVLGSLGCKHVSSSRPVTKADPVVSWDPRGIAVSAFMVSDDFDGLVEGNGSVLTKADLPRVAHVDLVTTAKQYESDFNANEIAADQKYRAKKVLIDGTVASINKDVIGTGYFTLVSPSAFGVQARLGEADMERAALTKKGDRVALACSPGMRVAGSATLDECLFLSDYLRKERLTPEDEVQGFFAGNVAIPYSEYAEATFGYALGARRAAECLRLKSE